MASSPILLEIAQAHDAPLLANLIELYAHDLSAAFDLEVGPDGRFGYPQLPSYRREPDRRFAFLIRSGSQLAGFALVTRGSPVTSNPADLDVAEFFVLRRYRRAGVGAQAAAALWDRMPGHWIVRVAERNHAALPFWARVIADYSQEQFTQTQIAVAGMPWTVFGFDSRGPE